MYVLFVLFALFDLFDLFDLFVLFAFDLGKGWRLTPSAPARSRLIRQQRRMIPLWPFWLLGQFLVPHQLEMIRQLRCP